MPQMAPLWWTSLYIMFIMTMMLFYMLIYFNNKYKMMKSTKKMEKIKNNWMW
uniref:ATP synthase F0 subunit 8 n=1 Tax=Sigara lateralis TaxID=537456 RepID=UPI00286CDEDE|nr:ATP synthase F0 subunit 8 [Sigara lateralis]WKD80503.1 ATP synthase F0 subunit 8 [Sigara lateralis]